jgi:hypothetical protein
MPPLFRHPALRALSLNTFHQIIQKIGPRRRESVVLLAQNSSNCLPKFISGSTTLFSFRLDHLIPPVFSEQ